MRDSSHKKHIDIWAEHVLSDPGWKKEHSAFINAQFDKAESFMRKIALKEDGVKRLAQIYNIKNLVVVENFVKSVTSKNQS